MQTCLNFMFFHFIFLSRGFCIEKYMTLVRETDQGHPNEVWKENPHIFSLNIKKMMC